MQECWGLLRPALKNHFELGAKEMIWCGLAVGKSDTSHPVNSLRSERVNIEEVADFRGF